MTEKFDAIVVGGGPAGCASACVMAKSGLNVLLFERGQYAGAKNMWGGAFFGPQLKELFPNFREEAPVERFVTRHTFSFLTKKGSTTLDFKPAFSGPPSDNGFIVMRAKFDKWLAKKVEQAGAIVVTSMLVDDLLLDGGRVTGVRIGKEEFSSDAVILAEGVNGILAQKAGLCSGVSADNMKQGVKEVIALPKQTIEDRFNVNGSEGAAMEFVGSCTRGVPGGGFLYTNKESLSVGIVVELGALVKNRLKASDLLEEFKEYPDVARLIRGGKTVEYSAHLIPTGGLKMMPKLFSAGVLVAGDAAALVLGTGLILEGANFAMASGVAAAETVITAKKKNDFSETALRDYERLLREGFVLRDMHTFKETPRLLKNTRIYDLYPEVVFEVLENILENDGKPRTKAYKIAGKVIKTRVGFARLLSDLWAMRKMT
ncbi:MAG: Electron transfer flavoprotein-ubiquinone oxidoreductase [Syntrophorhabdus sp. PtaU1.Bin058]|nr:MAG: Electron transfer flavoprotein-ubiquinone oxidoreductase [Syntrophorhabdus sp. PtaU1.Bin058]